MERLTTNKDISEMGMYELAHNSCYYKDGVARYRDFENDIDARELTRHLLKDYADGDDAFVDEDDFDEEMIELLMYGTRTTEGLIALFYRNMWAMADLREILKEYEDAEEQGLLLRLPCNIGDTIYEVSYENREFVIKEHIVKEFIYRTYRFPRIEIYCENENGFLVCNNIGKLDECLFLTQAEAEQKLKEMENR